LHFEELSMSSSEEVINNMTDNAIYEPLQKDVEAVKNAISALTNQISDALNSFAGTAEKQARRGYKQARSNVEAAVSDFTKCGGAARDAAHEAANTLLPIATMLADQHQYFGSRLPLRGLLFSLR
jgi:ElaB/YqjD/DUF883 family membrane-anchored ribosome-binding protein